MRDLDRHLAGWGFTALVLYALMYGAFMYVKRDPRPSAWLTGYVDAHYMTVCPDYLTLWPKDEHSAANCARELREEAMMGALFVPVPLSVLIGSFFLVLTHLGVGALIIRTSSPLCETVKKGLELIKIEPGLLSLPALSCVAVSSLLGLVFWRAFNDPRAYEINRYQTAVLAWMIILAPAVVAGYFATAFLLLMTNAALIHAYLAQAAGRRASFAASVLAALRLAPAIAALSVAVFGFLAGLYGASSVLRGGLYRMFGTILGWSASEAVSFGGFFLESGLLIATQLVIAAMLEENLSLSDAIRRAAGLIKPAGREVLTAAFGMATMRHDACVAALVGPMGAGYMSIPLFINSMGTTLACSLAAGILCGSLYFAFLSALEGVFAAGIYAYATGGRILPGLERGELQAFLGGLRATAGPLS